MVRKQKQGVMCICYAQMMSALLMFGAILEEVCCEMSAFALEGESDTRACFTVLIALLVCAFIGAFSPPNPWQTLSNHGARDVPRNGAAR